MEAGACLTGWHPFSNQLWKENSVVHPEVVGDEAGLGSVKEVTVSFFLKFFSLVVYHRVLIYSSLG